MQHAYGLDLDLLWVGVLHVTRCADLAANLPPGSLVWRKLDVPRAWTGTEYLMAMQIDQMNLWLWANSDPKKRGRQPKPLPRPGDSHAKPANVPERASHTVKPMGVAPDELDRILAQPFRDVETRETIPAPES